MTQNSLFLTQTFLIWYPIFAYNNRCFEWGRNRTSLRRIRTVRVEKVFFLSHAARRRESGFTLVELLVVIAIIGILVALLLPAIQAAREAARRNTCKNNLKQLALGWMNHESVTGHFPTGGWGHNWVGDADRGFGKEQPGGWMYNILPYIEQQALHDLPSDGQPDVLTAQQLEGALQVIQQPIATIICPSRRSDSLCSYNPSASGAMIAHNVQLLPVVSAMSLMVGRGDYAANCGDQDDGAFGFSNDKAGPSALASQVYESQYDNYTGVSFDRSEMRIQQITDGLSNTYMVGERFLNVSNYTNGSDLGDGETWCTGFNNDNYRSAFIPPRADDLGTGDPEYARKTSAEKQLDTRLFGSAHTSTWHIALCDGSVHAMSYNVDLNIHRNLANRADGQVVEIK